jgi:hypothetical protein
MATATFFVNQTNSPPRPVLLAGPPAGSILPDTAQILSWHPTSDPDVGDWVEAYHVQVATNLSFTGPAIDDANIPAWVAPTGEVWTIAMPLSAFSGAGNLRENTTYFWRMRARDSWNDYSSWSTGVFWFVYGTPPPNLNLFTIGDAGKITMSWDRTAGSVYVDFTPSLSPADWQPVAGPLYGTNVTINPPAGEPTGFYRVRTE